MSADFPNLMQAIPINWISSTTPKCKKHEENYKIYSNKIPQAWGWKKQNLRAVWEKFKEKMAAL